MLEAQAVDYTHVLDLYAGSGLLGIEALSRGDGMCDFVERDERAAGVIKENLASIGFAERGRVHRCSAGSAPDRLDSVYSLVLADPPYEDGAAIDTLERIARSQLVGPDTVLVLEHSSRREPVAALGDHPLAWSRRYGDTQVSIYRRGVEQNAPAAGR